MLQNDFVNTNTSEVVKPFRLDDISISQDDGGSHHILIIDDSNQICSALLTGIVRSCAETGRTCNIVQAGPFGLIKTMPMTFAPGPSVSSGLTIYTANSPQHALPVLRQPYLRRLTIICDVIMPNDTEVGLLGFLRELTELNLPVNLLFASGEGQNRYYVEELINSHKAYFVEKGTSAWIDLPLALVQRSNLFKYQVIVRSDYDKGRLIKSETSTGRLNRTEGTTGRLQNRVGTNELASPARYQTGPLQPRPQTDNLSARAVTGELNSRAAYRPQTGELAGSQQRSIPPARPQTGSLIGYSTDITARPAAPALAPVERVVAPAVEPPNPRGKGTTGLLSALAFWRKKTTRNLL
ncbi:MAG TPA: hypothetical protein VH186_16860 [Chloroflexia bacterium]|nr:hypothetical protein [Chloroflexia bacterium]